MDDEDAHAAEVARLRSSLETMVNVFNRKEIDPFAAFAAIEQAKGALGMGHQ
jgi:hypothetical protein